MKHSTEPMEMHQPAAIGADPMGWTWRIARPDPVSRAQLEREARKVGRASRPTPPLDRAPDGLRAADERRAA